MLRDFKMQEFGAEFTVCRREIEKAEMLYKKGERPGSFARPLLLFIFNNASG